MALQPLKDEGKAYLDEPDLQKAVDTFSALPTELILHIFGEYCATEPNGPLFLSLVCTQWLEFVSNNPELWTYLVINPNESSWQDRVEVYSHQSRERLLDITLYCPISADEVQEISRHDYLGRWRTLTIIDGGSNVERDPWRFPLRLGQSRLLLKLLQGHSFPELHTMDVNTKSVNRRAPYLWNKLFSEREIIEGLGPRSVFLSHLTVNIFFIDVESFLDTLKEVPELHYLKLTAQRGFAMENISTTRSEQVDLLHLEALVLEDGSPTQLLLNDLHFPSIRYLKMSLMVQNLRQACGKIRTLKKLKDLTLVLYDNEGSFPEETTEIVELEKLQIEHHFMILTTSAIPTYPAYLKPLFCLFPSVKQASFLLDKANWSESTAQAAWNDTLKFFPKLEELSIETTRYTPQTQPLSPPTFSRYQLDIPYLKHLRLKGQSCRPILPMIHAPGLRGLELLDIKDFNTGLLFGFLHHSPHIRLLKLESIQVSDSSIPDNGAPYSFEEVIMTHDAYRLLKNINTSNIQTLRLIGVPQGVAMSQDNYHFDQRTIDMQIFQSPPNILYAVTHLDLCVASTSFPLVVGLKHVVPQLHALEKISLPRLRHRADILVDDLIQAALDTNYCPSLKEIHTEDYPEWASLMHFIINRNISPVQAPLIAHIQCLYLPALPHLSILEPLQMALAGKLPVDFEQIVFIDDNQISGCDDCSLTGWPCLEPNIISNVKITGIRVQCSRHKSGMVRIAAYS